MTMYTQYKYMYYPDSKIHGAHLGPTGPRWAPCWSYELCYLGTYWTSQSIIPQYSQKKPHSLPRRASYGVFFVSSKPDLFDLYCIREHVINGTWPCASKTLGTKQQVILTQIVQREQYSVLISNSSPAVLIPILWYFYFRLKWTL